MSHYSYIQGKIQDTEVLLEALKKFSFEPESYEEPVHLYGYQGDERKQLAHIVVRRGQISTASNDLGFFRQEDGTYSVIISDYDSSYGTAQRGKGLGTEFLTKLKANYATALVEKEVARIPGMKIESIERAKDGRIKIVAQGRSAKSPVSSSLSNSL